MRLNVLRSLVPDEKVPPCYVKVVEAPQEKGTSWEGSLTASRDKQGLEQRQELKKTVTQEVGQNVETSGQAEASWSCLEMLGERTGSGPQRVHPLVQRGRRIQEVWVVCHNLDMVVARWHGCVPCTLVDRRAMA